VELDFVAYAGIVGALLPLLISLLKQSTWSAQVKKYFAFAVSVVAAVIVTGASEGWNAFNWANLVTAGAVIIPLAQTMYTGFWEDNAVEVRLAAVGDKSI
jgi:uncharacterized membrane protein YkvI